MVNIGQKDLKFIAENKNKNETKFKFQGQYTRSQCWFDLEFDWIDVNFRTHELDLYKRLFQIHDNTQDINTFKFFQFPTGNSKCVENFKVHNDVPILKYFNKFFNNCSSVVYSQPLLVLNKPSLPMLYHCA